MLSDLLAANRAYAAHFSLGGLDGHAARRFALLTCMDCRIDPLRVLGLAPGDAKILRNAGGRVTEDVVRSLVLATNMLGVEEIVVMHHRGCALASQDDEALRSAMTHPDARAWPAPLLSMGDPDDALRGDVDKLRSCAALGAVTIEGWRYDIATGLVERVVADTAARS